MYLGYSSSMFASQIERQRERGRDQAHVLASCSHHRGLYSNITRVAIRCDAMSRCTQRGVVRMVKYTHAPVHNGRNGCDSAWAQRQPKQQQHHRVGHIQRHSDCLNAQLYKAVRHTHACVRVGAAATKPRRIYLRHKLIRRHRINFTGPPCTYIHICYCVQKVRSVLANPKVY